MQAGVDIEIAHVAGGVSLAGHGHDAWHLVVVNDGGLEQEVDGLLYAIGPGCMRLSPPNRMHRICASSSGLICAIATVEAGWAERVGAAWSDTFFCDSALGRRLGRILADQASDPVERELVVRAALAAVAEAGRGRRLEAPPPWLDDAHSLIREGEASARIGRLVEQTGFSRAHVSRQFRRYFGLTPVELRNSLRVGQALALLRETDLPLAAIANEAGFSDQSHLAREVKLKSGLTPLEVRRRAKSAEVVSLRR